MPDLLQALLQVPAAAVEHMPTQLPYLLSGAGLLLAIYTLFRKEGREDGQTTPQRLRKLEATAANQELRQQGFQEEIEQVADHGRRERLAIVENTKRDLEALREQIKDVPDMRNLLARMDERARATKEEIKSLKDDVKNLAIKADRIVELLTPKK